MRSTCLILFLSCVCWALGAQQTLWIALPDAHIVADRLTKGDCDTYGLGDWHCRFTATIEDSLIVLNGSISFSENANDYTTIVGAWRSELYVAELARCSKCRLILHDNSGQVSGKNIGARGYQTVVGKGMIRKARVLSDTFGCDAGKLGAYLSFRPILLAIHCEYAGGAEGQRQDLTGF